MQSTFDAPQRRAEICRKPLAVLDLLELVGGPPDDPRRDAERRQLVSNGLRVVDIQRLRLSHERLCVAVASVMRRMRIERSLGGLLGLMALREHQLQELAERAVGAY